MRYFYCATLVALSALVIPRFGFAQEERAFAATYEGEVFEILFRITKEKKYEIEKKDDPTTTRELVRIDDSDYFQIKLDEVFDDLDSTASLKLTSVSKDLFSQIQVFLRDKVFAERLALARARTLVGILRVEKDPVPVYKKEVKSIFSKSSPAESTDHSLQVKAIRLAFASGLVIDMNVLGMMDGKEVQFRNRTDIPLSTPKEIEKFNTGSFLLERKVSESDKKYTYSIDPSKVLRYEREVIGHGLFVPIDTTIRIRIGETDSVALKKHPFVRNFDGRLYSDVTGLDANNPNGVLQIEVAYDHVFNAKTVNSRKLFWRSVILFNRISPFVTFPKLQDKLSSLPVDNLLTVDTMMVDTMLAVPVDPMMNMETRLVDTTLTVTETSLNRLQATSIDVLRFANLHLGVNTNIFRYSDLGTRLEINFEAGLYRTQIDTSSVTREGTVDISNIDQINLDLEKKDGLFWYLSPSFTLNLFQSREFDFDLGASYMWLRSLSREVRLEGRQVIKLQANANVHPNPNTRESSVFFRATYFKAVNDFGRDPNSNLTLQIGYATPISRIFGGN